MSLATGTPQGNIVQQNAGLFVEGAPYIYYQDYNANPLFNPDGDDYYYGMSGTTQYPVYELLCYQDVSLSDDVTVNMIRCDREGDIGSIQKRNYMEISFTLSTLFPLSTLAPVLRGSQVTENAPFEKFGFGPIDNTQFYMVYLPKVYDPDTGDNVLMHFHKCQFVNAFDLSFPSGDRWQVGGVTLRAYSDETNRPSNQQFGTVIRTDPSLIT